MHNARLLSTAIDIESHSQSENDIHDRTLKASIIPIITNLILDLLIKVGSNLELNPFPSKYLDLQSWTKVVETYGNCHHIFPSCEFSSLPS